MQKHYTEQTEQTKKIRHGKKWAGLFFVCLFFMFTLIHLKLYKDEILPVRRNPEGKMTQELSLYDGVLAEQKMTVVEEEDNYLDLYLRNPALRGNAGKFRVSLFDGKGTEVFRKQMPAVRIGKKDRVRIRIRTELSGQEVYTLKIITGGIEEKKALKLGITKTPSDFFTELKVNHAVQDDQRMMVQLMHPGWNMQKILLILSVFAAVILLILIPVRLPDRWNHTILRILYSITPIVCFAVVQKTCTYRMFSMELPALLLNLWIYAMILTLIYIFTNNIRLASTITVIFSYGMALINYFVTAFRGTVFVPADFSAAGTAANVVESYRFQIDTGVLWGGIGVMLFLTLLFKLRPAGKMRMKGRLVILFCYLISVAVFAQVFYQSDALEEWGVHYKVWNPNISYDKNGFAVCFAVGSRYLIPEKPKGYSAQKLRADMEPYIEEAEKQKVKEGRKPNIIGIMNEAFSDLSVDGDLKTTEDYMPFIRGLKENTIKGNLHVTSFGGRTANTEYEFLTGMSMAFFPGGTVPYEHQMKHDMRSLAGILKDYDYTGMIAMHPYKSDGYNRENAYPKLGFERYYSETLFKDPERVRTHISDEADFQMITKLYEESKKKSDDPFFLFNVTMQNHGGYEEDFDNLPLDIKIEGKQKNEGAERYLNLIRKTDEAFKHLIGYFEQTSDPTVIVMFGDHQPNLSEEFFDSLMGSHEQNTLEGIRKKHMVPFVIWANYDIPEEEIEEISVNYLGTKVMEAAGLRKTPFQCFLTRMQKEIPVITGNYYIGKDGKIRETDDIKGYEEWLSLYHNIQYNEVYDYDHMVEEIHELPERKSGETGSVKGD